MIRVLFFLSFACASLRADSSAGQAITTGKDARVEHSLEGGGLVRFGSNTQAQIQQDGTLKLGMGLCLVSSDSGWLRHEAVTVITAAGKITVRGTALIAVMVDGSLKITCLEGKVKGDDASGAQVLKPGQMMVRTKDGKSAKAEVELASLIQTCVLLGADFKLLARSSAIASHSERQNKVLAKAVARQISSGLDVVIPGQSNAPGASNMVAVASAFPNSQVLAGTRAADIGYSSASTVVSMTPIGGNPFDGAGWGNSGAVISSSTGATLSSGTGAGSSMGAGLTITVGTTYHSGSVWNLLDWSSAQ
jgi:hypothetical protein